MPFIEELVHLKKLLEREKEQQPNNSVVEECLNLINKELTFLNEDKSTWNIADSITSLAEHPVEDIDILRRLLEKYGIRKERKIISLECVKSKRDLDNWTNSLDD